MQNLPPFFWSGHEWAHGQKWGLIHPNNTRQYYDPYSVVVNHDKTLTLETEYKPQWFTIEGEKVFSPVGVGLISSTSAFSYGTFEIVAQLPSGKNLWPAFWLTAENAWPPEIDVFEAYTNSLGNYWHFDWKTPFAWWNIKTNIHYRGSMGKGEVGGKSKYFTFKNPRKKFIKYTLEWTPDKIEIKYDDIVVRLVTSQAILKTYKGHKMNVILNNAVNHDADLDSSHKKSKFNIHSFKYTPYNG